MVAALPLTRSARNSLIAISVLWVLGAAVTFLRLLGRFRGAGIKADDILALTAVLLSAATVGFNAAVFRAGVGYNFDPQLEVYPDLAENLPFIMKITFTFTLVYLWTLVCLKMSQLYFYWRVFSVQLKKWILIVAVIVFCWAIIFTFIFTFLCDPVAQQWTLQRVGHCMNQILVLKSIIMTNVITDLFIFVLPISTVWKLQMRTMERVAVTACFALGLACVAIAIVRFWQIFVINLLQNLTGTSLTTFMLCTVELLLASLCINIPMLRPFYTRWRAQYKSTYAENSTGSGFKESRTGNLVPNGRSDNHTTWIELDHDATSIDDNSERQLRADAKTQIHVATGWNVRRE